MIWDIIQSFSSYQTEILGDYPAHRIRPLESCHVTNKITDAAVVSCSTHVEESSLIGDRVVPAISHDSAKNLSTKSIQTAAFTGFDAQNVTTI